MNFHKNSELSPLVWLTFANLRWDKPYLCVAMTNDSIGHHQIFSTVVVCFKFPWFFFSKLEYSALNLYLFTCKNLIKFISYLNMSYLLQMIHINKNISFTQNFLKSDLWALFTKTLETCVWIWDILNHDDIINSYLYIEISISQNISMYMY